MNIEEGFAVSTIGIGRRFSFLSRFFAAEDLTRKAYLNAINAVVNNVARVFVTFVITPLLVAGLGDYYFGAWQILNRLVSYISPASGNPLEALKWTLAHEQASTDFDQKRRYVGSAAMAGALFLPLTGVAGGVVAWFVPYWLRASTEAFWLLRASAALMVLNLVFTMAAGLPQAILCGENLGYKRMGLRSLLTVVGGGLAWLALRLGTGIVGIALAGLVSTTLSGLLLFLVARLYIPWFGIARPSPRTARRFLGLSWWFLAWDLVSIVMISSDVVALGLLNSLESVTAYSLTKYAPDTLSTIIGVIVTGVTPGLGGIVGSGDLKRATRVRSEVMTLAWLALAVLGSSILLWNRSFLGLWVGSSRFAGSISALLIVAVATQLVLIRTDAEIIDLTLRIDRKVLIGALSAGLALGGAVLLVGVFRLGIVGLCLGLIIGRSILSLGYPMLIGRFLGISLQRQLAGVIRPAAVTVLLFMSCARLDCILAGHLPSGTKGWAALVASAGVTFVVFLLVAFRAGLSVSQRRSVLKRVRTVIGKGF